MLLALLERAFSNTLVHSLLKKSSTARPRNQDERPEGGRWRVPIRTGVTEAIRPTSLSFCMSRLIRAGSG